MLHHISISANDPPRVAQVLAELISAKCFEFPLHGIQGCYRVIAGDSYGSSIEVMPQNLILIPGSEEVNFETREVSQVGSVHLALSVSIRQEKNQEIGQS